jgi:hypothetical protein
LRDSNVSALVAFGSNLFAGTLNGMFRSTDSGATWNEVSAGLPIYPYIEAFAQNGTSLFATANNLGVFVSTDSGISWKPASNGLPALSVSALVTDGTNLYADDDGGLSLSTDSGVSWNLVQTGLTDGVNVLAVSGSNLYVGTDNNTVYLTTDHGASWTLILDTIGVINKMGNSTVFYDVSAFAVFGTNLFAGLYGGGILRSTDVGSNWSSVDTGLPAGTHVISFAAIGTHLFAGTLDLGVYVSSDNGTSWTSAGLSDPGNVNVLAVSGSNLFAAPGDEVTNGSVYLSTDNGTSWTNVNTGLPTNTYVSALAVSGASSSSPMLFAGDASGGVYLSTNNGESWTSVGLDSIDPDVGIRGFAIAGSYLYAATRNELSPVGGGVWRRPLSEMIPAQSVVTEAPMGKQAIQSHPNPFFQSTQISFTSPEAGYADISIVNLLGEQVARIFSGELDAGEHSFSWSNPTGLPDGTYECLLRMNGQVQTLPIVLMR